MKYFLLQPTRPKPDFTVLRRKWSLPGIRCPVCDDAWASVGTSYSTVSLEGLTGSEDYTVPRPVPPEEFETLRQRVQPLLPTGSPLPPGTCFGPITLEGTGSFPDFVWPTLWILLIRRELRGVFDEINMVTSAIDAESILEGEESENFLEVQSEPLAFLAPGTGMREIPPCPACGRREFSKPRDRPLVLDKASIPQVDIFRLIDLPSHIVASERFKNLVTTHAMTGIEFQEIGT